MKQFNKQSIHTAGILFVAKAVSLPKARKSDNIQHIYCDGSDIVATDEHRLHIYTPEECPLVAGYYSVIKKTKTEIILHQVELDMEYPNYKRITPENKTGKGFKFVEHGSTSTAPTDNGKYAQVIRAMECFTVDIDYFRDACQDMTEYQVTDDTSPVLLIGENIKAVIMPVRC